MRRKTVAIVEDDFDIREIITYILGGNAYAIETYSTVTAFKDHLNEQLPDVIVLDIMLPDGDGVALCREIKTNEKTKHIPVLLMSANKYERETEAYANAFISKPFDIDVFKQKVETFL